MLTTGDSKMSDNRDAEFEASMSDVAEEAATGVAAIKKGATAGEKIDTSGGNFTNIGGTDNKTEEGAKGTKNLGSSAAAPVGVEGDKSIKTKPSDASAKMEEVEDGDFIDACCGDITPGDIIEGVVYAIITISLITCSSKCWW